ncbi:hypothetical protein DER44DRAFT_799259, partial [Fusarium oxysporum]
MFLLCPFMAAHDSGVIPFLSFESTSTPSVLSSRLTVASCPVAAAHDSGVIPSLFFEFTSTPSV